MNHTTNLNLPQWEENDRILRTDFNDAFAAIDAAIPRIATGSYVGTGEYGSEHPNSITFPFTPKVIALIADSNFGSYEYTDSRRLVWDLLSTSYTNNYRYVWAYDYNSRTSSYGKKSGNTFSWYDTNSSNGPTNQFNISGRTYYWLAIG